MINLKNHPTLAWVVDYWPWVVLVPTILLVIAVLVLVTHCWDRRDESVRARQRAVLGRQRQPHQSGTQLLLGEPCGSSDRHRPGGLPWPSRR
jgi:hypothetical protein